MKLLVFLGVFFFMCSNLLAQQTNNANKDLQAVEKKINRKKNELKEIENKRKSILGSLQKIDKKKDGFFQVSQQASKDIRKKEQSIEKTKNEISEISAKLGQQKDFMKAHMQHLYQHGSINVLQTWFQKMEINDRRRQNVWITHWVKKEKEKVLRYEDMVGSLEKKHHRLEYQKNEKEKLLQEMQEHEKNLGREKANKQKLLASIKNQKQLYQQSLDELEQASRKIQKLINQFDDAPSVDLGVFERARGTLAHPVPGKITRRYGSYEDKTLKAKLYHKGMDYSAQMGDAVKSVFQGKVMYTGWFEGYGKVVIVDHGSYYYSLYAHLSHIKVDTHQQVQRGTVIGAVGDTGSLHGAHLYFELRKKGVTVNPQPWFG